MLDDRDYMRAPDRWKGGPMSLTGVLCLVLVGVFLFQYFNTNYLRLPMMDYLALTSYGVKHGWVWQLITFQFLHANVLHLLGNLISFWWLGRAIEGYLGRQRFAIALFGCGAIGGLLQGLLMLAFPNYYGGYVVGASAGISGLLAIFALMDQGAEVMFNFIFPVRVITLLYVYGGISLFFTVFPGYGGNVAHAAHLGGMLAGVAWVKLGWHRDYVRLPWEGWFASRRDKTAVSKRRPTIVIDPDLEAEASAREVDRILEKISAQGIGSLTASERETLESARKQMNSK
jgi:membrane associated rhomboid family serine protease